MGILISVLIGMAALGAEIPFVIYEHRQLQNAADAAALGGAIAMTRGYPASPATEAQAIAAALGFVNGTGGVTVTINSPPKSGAYVGNASAIEAIISQPQTLKLGALFYSSALNLSARAVALQGSSGGYCLLATNNASATGIDMSNGVAVNLRGCGAASNAKGAAGVLVTGAAILTATTVSASGEVNINNGGIIVASVKSEQSDTDDPYENVPMPASAGCDYTNFTLGWASSTQQMNPGRYCGGVSIGNGAIVSMAPGIYYIKSGVFNIGGGIVLTGSGVTIVLTQNTSGYAYVSIGNGASVTLSAPTSGSTSGILFFADRNGPSSTVNYFNGGAAAVLTGALYFPTEQVNFSNGVGASVCTQVIGWQIQFTGGVAATINANCAGTGVTTIGAGNALVE